HRRVHQNPPLKRLDGFSDWRPRDSVTPSKSVRRPPGGKGGLGMSGRRSREKERREELNLSRAFFTKHMARRSGNTRTKASQKTDDLSGRYGIRLSCLRSRRPEICHG